MTCFLATVRLDVWLQHRHGLYLFTTVSTLLVILAVRALIPRDALPTVIPILFFFYLGSTAFMFCAAQLLLERSEGTLDALAVTPLRSREYLLSKVVTLAGLAALESLTILVFTYGLDFHGLLLVLGVVGQAVLYTLISLVVVVRYDSVTYFLMTSPVLLTPLFVPALGVTGLWQTPIYYLWPTYPPLVLLQGAMHGTSLWEVVYATLYLTVAAILFYRWAYRAFTYHIVQGGGAHERHTAPA